MVAARRPAGLCTEKPAASDDETFFGTAREVPKTTIPQATPETFASVTVLRNDIAQKSDDLVMIDQGVSTKCDETRHPQERRIVTVTGYLYAMKREDDNDYHLILGAKNCSKPGCFMTAEVSGIPRIATNKQQLATARKHFQSQIEKFAGDGKVSGGYFKFDPPIPVEVTGPLFYDADHKINQQTHAGAVGPSFARPSTSWEIHPVMQIELDPDGQ
jgi:hypothetical protein